MSDSASHIAVRARRFELLAERHPGEEPQHTLTDPQVGPLDAMLLAAASDLDRFCGEAVSMLGQRSPAAPVLKLLGTLPGGYKQAIYFALPDDRREAISEHPSWAYHVAAAPEGIETFMSLLSTLAGDPEDDESEALDPIEAEARRILEPEEASEFRDFNSGLLRRQLCLPPELTDGQERLAIVGEDARRVA